MPQSARLTSRKRPSGETRAMPIEAPSKAPRNRSSLSRSALFAPSAVSFAARSCRSARLRSVTSRAIEDTATTFPAASRTGEVPIETSIRQPSLFNRVVSYDSTRSPRRTRSSNLITSVAIDPFGRGIPVGDRSVKRRADDGFSARGDDGEQPRPGFLHPKPLTTTSEEESASSAGGRRQLHRPRFDAAEQSVLAPHLDLATPRTWREDVRALRLT